MSFFDKLTGRVTDFLDDVLLPDELRTTVLRAQKAVENQAWDEALRLLDQLDERKPGLRLSWELRGESLLGLSRYEEAAEAYQKALASRPDPRALRSLATALEHMGDWRAARGVLREALHRDPNAEDRYQIHRALGRIHLSMNRADKAVRELRKALRVARNQRDWPDERRANAAVALTSALLVRNEPEEARRTLEEFFDERTPPHELSQEALRVLGQLLLSQERASQALVCHEELLRRDPDDITARLDAGRAALQLDQPQRALDLLASIDPQNSPLHFEILATTARAELALSNPQRALTRALEVLDERPRHLDALATAGWSLLALSQQSQEAPEESAALLQRAEVWFDRLRAVKPSSWEALHGLGRCRSAREDYLSARRLLGASLELGAGPEVTLDLSEAVLASREPATAVVLLSDLMSTPRAHADIAFQQRASALLEQAYKALAVPIALPAQDCLDLAQMTAGLRQLRDYIAQTPRLVSFLSRVQEILHGLDTPLSIAIMGEFNAGKSTLVNAFVGEAILPTGVLPTTAHINILRFGARRVAQLHKRDSSIQEMGYREVKKAVKRDDRSRTIAHIEYLHPHPDLRRIHFWDTPGFNALDPDHELHAREALEKAEAIFWLLDAGQALTDSEFQRIETITNAHDRLLIVLNKVDRLGQGQARSQGVEEILAHVREHLGEKVLGIFPISGLEGLKARQNEDKTLLEGSGITPFLDKVETDIFDRTARLKTLDAHEKLGALLTEIQSHTQTQAERFEARYEPIETLRQGVLTQKEDLYHKLLDEERSILRGSMDMLLNIAVREIDDALQPASGLVDVLLTRMELDREDIQFVLSLIEERFDDLLGRSCHRLMRSLQDDEQRLVESFDALLDVLEPADVRALSRRLEAWLAETSALRLLLTERVYGRYRAVAQGRLSAPGAENIVKRAAQRDIDETEQKQTLTQLLPAVEQDMMEDLQQWGQEYFSAALRLCDVIRGDLQVMSIQSKALTTGLHIPPTHEHA